MANQLKWLGHAGWQLTTAKGKVLLIDPWLSQNPVAPIKIEDLPAADYLLLTHDHFDHAGDACAVVKQTGATVVAVPELAAACKAQGVPEDNILYNLGMNVGGTVDLGGVSCTMTDAHHSSTHGDPAGFLLTLEDGQVVYHSGDTGIFPGMALWGELYPIDVALLPIGSVFTMDPRQAARAVRMLKPGTVIPMHYKTFPLLTQSADEFARLVQEQAPTTRVSIVEPGGTHEF